MRLTKRQKIIKQKIKSSNIRVGDFVRYVGVPRSLSGTYICGYTIVYDILGTRHKSIIMIYFLLWRNKHNSIYYY